MSLTATLNANTKKVARLNNKKVAEVKEVIQNRSDSDIAKVLEYYDNDVGKTIDAFVNDGGKEALAKWAETKSQLNSSQSSLISDSGKKPKRKNSPSKSQNNKPNLNDLVASVINQYTTSTPSTPLSASLSPQEAKKAEPQLIIDSLSRLNTETNINGYKITILGIETPNSNPGQSVVNSSSTSPSSMSVASTNSSCDRPQSINLNNSLLKIPANRQFNKSFINPNAKQILEKSVKDLQRQTVQLNKIQSGLQDHVENSSQLLNKTYQQLIKVLNERRQQLENELKKSSQQAMGLIQERQQKAANLKYLTDNSQHLNDSELNELKADLKHFVSERQIDEDFMNIKFLNLDHMDKLIGDLSSFGSVYQVKNQYSTQRAANIDDILTPVSNVEKKLEPQQPQQQQQQQQQNPKPQRTNNVNNKNKVNGVINNGVQTNGTKHVDDDGEGEFIEVKKPQRNRNKQQNGTPQNGQLNGTQRPVNGVQNGTSRNPNPRR